MSSTVRPRARTRAAAAVAVTTTALLTTGMADAGGTANGVFRFDQRFELVNPRLNHCHGLPPIPSYAARIENRTDARAWLYPEPGCAGSVVVMPPDSTAFGPARSVRFTR
ncbi:hypothetical protein SAMN05421810_103729 [Amycolatopsis arida]|uniref:Secreted protein n=1 Tax=Amycolatopsis arida TaxID=587909 RepID=A0A1I5TZ83_9PSEU|nr:hypothetical protein [Amycolatopsis arida]TDX95896.1 hypothetical protein CLV69_10328 [Amycolatopsis arida]SFP88375.1 hypothetical protein SAMN05421810_103729 [Amycolatopsis arida]